MVAFLDIEEAFNNSQPQAIINELDQLGVDPLLKSVIDQLLRCRIIKTTLGAQTILRTVARGIIISSSMEYCNKSFAPKISR